MYLGFFGCPFWDHGEFCLSFLCLDWGKDDDDDDFYLCLFLGFFLLPHWDHVEFFFPCLAGGKNHADFYLGGSIFVFRFLWMPLLGSWRILSFSCLSGGKSHGDFFLGGVFVFRVFWLPLIGSWRTLCFFCLAWGKNHDGFYPKWFLFLGLF